MHSTTCSTCTCTCMGGGGTLFLDSKRVQNRCCTNHTLLGIECGGMPPDNFGKKYHTSWECWGHASQTIFEKNRCPEIESGGF